MSCIAQYNLLQNTIELFIEQLIILNKKIENLEEKINNKNNNNIIYINNKSSINSSNIDWDSIHLY
jgi:hypothetical protein